MRPGQGRKNKKDPKHNGQWKRLLIEARLSRQLHYMKLARQKSNQLNDRHRTDQPTNQPSDPQTDQPTNQVTTSAEKSGNDQINQQPAPSPNTFLSSINSRLNNATFDEVISEIQHKIMAHVNSQPLHVEQELRKRRTQQQQSRQDEIICRICFLPTSELYQPCKCDGTMKFIHRQCLSDWIRTNRSRNCNICYAKYTGLTVIYHYPSAARWLISDLFAVRQMICFLLMISISFVLYSKRALEFYSIKIGSYREQTNLAKMSNYYFANAFSGQEARSGKFSLFKSKARLHHGHPRTNMTASELAMNDLSNLTGAAVSRVCKVLNDTVTAVSGNELAGQNNHASHRRVLISLFSLEGNQPREPACESYGESYSQTYKVYGHHHRDDQLDERFTYSTNVLFWYLLAYLVNDLIQIALYALVWLLFVRYFIRLWLIWRHRNRKADVVFEETGPSSSALN